MNDFFPLLVVFLFGVISFLSASKNGVVKLLASGTAAGLALLVMFLLIRLVPILGNQMGGIDVTWQVTVGIAVVSAGIVYVISRLIIGVLFKWLFGEESFLHGLTDGIPGGVLSIFPTFVVGFFLLTCVRIAGTLQELNYTASLSQPGIEARGQRIPPYPLSSQWRSGIESVPFLAAVMDITDPFSNRANRNTAAALLIQQSAGFEAYALKRPESGNVVEDSGIAALAEDPAIWKAMKSHDRIALNTNTLLQETAANFSPRKELVKMDLEPVLTGFVTHLEENYVAPAP